MFCVSLVTGRSEIIFTKNGLVLLQKFQSAWSRWDWRHAPISEQPGPRYGLGTPTTSLVEEMAKYTTGRSTIVRLRPKSTKNRRQIWQAVGAATEW
jgi:hypothetical protein